MGAEKSKETLLKSNGYRYNFYRMIYFNAEQKKVFSYEYIEDNSIELIQKKISEISNEWEFYFNMSVSDKVKEQILSELKSC